MTEQQTEQGTVAELFGAESDYKEERKRLAFNLFGLASFEHRYRMIDDYSVALLRRLADRARKAGASHIATMLETEATAMDQGSEAEHDDTDRRI